MAVLTLFAMHQYGRLDVMLLTALGNGDCYFCRVKITGSIIPPYSSKIYSLSVKFFCVLFFFQVVSRGRILSHNTTDPFDGMYRSWSFRISPQMSPSARLIGYYIDDNGRVVADSILLDIEDSLPTEVIEAFAYEIET